MARHFPFRESQGILNRLGKVRGNCKILEKSSNFRQMLSVIFSDIYKMNGLLVAKMPQVFS